jgi:hypothetical protein
MVDQLFKAAKLRCYFEMQLDMFTKHLVIRSNTVTRLCTGCLFLPNGCIATKLETAKQRKSEALQAIFKAGKCA